MNKNTVEITLQGKEYNFSFNFLIIKNLQNAIKGLKVEDIFQRVVDQDFNVISELLYRGIKFNHPDFSRDIVDNLGFSDIETVFVAIADLFGATMPTTKEVDIEGK